MNITEPVKRRDVLRRGYRFRSSVTGLFVSRAHALLWPHLTVKERRRP